MSPADSLDADAISTALRGRYIGNRVLVFEEATSTNDLVLQLAPQNVFGLVVFAEQQTAGRGQHGKRWESAARKGLWFSVLLRAGISPADAPGLTSLVAETIARTINDQFSLGATVEPPNDVYAAGRKIAGVLLELRAVEAKPHFGILGIGLNVNQRAEDFPEDLRDVASSLALLTGKSIDRQELAIILLRSLDRALTK